MAGMFCVAGSLALLPHLTELPELPELPFIWRAVRALVLIIKVKRLLAARRQAWRGLLFDMLSEAQTTPVSDAVFSRP